MPPAGPAPTSAAPTDSRPAAPVTAGPAWRSAPVSVVRHPPVPPVPVLTGVRSGAHPAEGYDRIVFDIDGALPGYTIRYVDQVRADPSDRPIAVPGERHLLVVLDPAQAHRTDGSGTVTGIHALGLTALTAYAIVGDFEGHVSIAVGLPRTAGFRAGELPGRIFLDVAR
ncbi:hypothetical protein Adu01nite_15740 [Paractinoplanes durhamensis]|uniref:AMIN-like domain-containing protein n=2 Tax=Paractinoplanes durhamensis TaxID=113563 RepID=A0ABQ3YS74_9ACTN|nr:hypothetical protein Adu01nite_15740 [Actinoplanes durhamensis]